MTQQKYIYPGTGIDDLDAIYSNPDPGAGITTVQTQITNSSLLYDRVISTPLELPYDFDEIKIQPNELVVSTAIFASLEKVHKNYLYINANSFISSNDLPGKYVGYFGATSGDDITSQEPEFVEYDSNQLYDHLPSLSAGDLADISPALDNLVDGIWLRDDSPVNTPLSGINHVGFLINPTTLTVVNMPAQDGDPLDGSYIPWKIVKEFTTVDETKDKKNQLSYTNLTLARIDNNNNLYILDKGNSTTGGTRSVIYKYDISGFITTKDIIESDKKFLLGSVGNVNYVTNPFDVLSPVGFDFDSNDNLILFDEGDYTFKKFDSRLNYVDKYTRKVNVFKGNKGTAKKYVGVADIVIDRETDDLYLLTPTGYVMVFDSSFNLKTQFRVQVDDSNQTEELPDDDSNDFNSYFGTSGLGSPNKEVFKTLDFSKNEPNVYYILTNNRIIKRFKTQDEDVGYFSFLDSKVGRANYREYPIFLNILQDARVTTDILRDEDDNPIETIDDKRTFTYDQIYIYSDTIDLSEVDNNLIPPQTSADLLLNKRHFLSCKEKVNLESVLLKDDYTIYDITPASTITYKEYTSNIIYNKVLYKMVYNHLQYLHNLRTRFAGKYNSTGSFVFNGVRYIDEYEYGDMLLQLQKNNFIGINEYFTADVVNRCLKQIYDIQVNIIQYLQVKPINTWPLETSNIAIEPYLYTSGGEYIDVDGKTYTGYYYYDIVNDIEVAVIGRRRDDGAKDGNGNPVIDRYLTTITT